MRSIKQIVSALSKPEGKGMLVRRTIGIKEAREFNPFLLLDHFSSPGTGGFPDHPHRGHETITYLLKGRIAHEDFTGAKGVLYPGDLQFMTAGKGIVHAEIPIPGEDGSSVEGLQLWVDLPHHLKNIEPRYRDLMEWEVPSAVKDNVEVKVIAGSWNGLTNRRELSYTPIEYYHAKIGPGAVYTQKTNKNFNYMAYILGGSAEINGMQINKHQNVFFENDGNEISIRGKADVALIGGEILNQKSIHFSVFVTETREEVKAIYKQYEAMSGPFERRKNGPLSVSSGVTAEFIREARKERENRKIH